ncbi:MAG: hypothetical protein ACRDQX_01145 [Pseudonocardiaceae bacterium]
MSAVRIHRTRLEDGGFAAVPNETARDGRLTWAARGYLAEMISNKNDWDPENAKRAAARAKRERGEDAESAWAVRQLHAELERAGYKHRVVRRGAGGLRSTETHYYDLPTQPCEDIRSCESCRHNGVTADTSPHQGQEDVSPGGTECGPTTPGAELGEQGVSQGGARCGLTRGSSNLTSPEDQYNQKTKQETKELTPPSPAASAPGVADTAPAPNPEPGTKASSDRRNTELAAAAFLLARFHLIDADADERVVHWLVRTLRCGDTPLATARYLLRCLLADRRLVGQLLDAEASGEHEGSGYEGDDLRELREVVRDPLPFADNQTVSEVAQYAAMRTHPGMSVREAVSAGLQLAGLTAPTSTPPAPEEDQ